LVDTLVVAMAGRFLGFAWLLFVAALDALA
jgi:hypothetical protein